MRIDPRQIGLPAPAAGSGRPRAGSGAFRLGDAPSASPASAAGGAVALGSLGALLALQEEDPRERRRRSARRGEEILAALDGLKAALLAGTVPAERLRLISAQLGRALPPSGDPELDGLVAAIELRARVELAKLERATAVGS